MTQDEFAALLARMTAAATRGDGAAFAACFTEDAVYHDYIYGDHTGRADIPGDVSCQVFCSEAQTFVLFGNEPRGMLAEKYIW